MAVDQSVPNVLLASSSTERRTQTGRPARLPPRSAARRVVVHVAGDTGPLHQPGVGGTLSGRRIADRECQGNEQVEIVPSGREPSGSKRTIEKR